MDKKKIIRFYVSVVVLLLFSVAACQTTSEIAPSKNQQAGFFVSECESSSAKAECYYNYGLDCLDIKDYAQAIKAFTRVIGLQPKHPFAYNERGIAFSHKREHEKAIEDYNKAIQLNPNDSLAYSNRGVDYRYLKQYDNAIADSNKAIALNPQFGDAYNNRGYAYLWMKEWELAKQDFLTLIQKEQENSYPYGNLAIYYWMTKKDKNKTFEYLEKAFQLGFNEFELLYDETDDGYFFKDLNQTAEFKELINKYKK